MVTGQLPAGRRISIFGATGSVGQNTVDVLRQQSHSDHIAVVALTGDRNIELLAQQAIELNAQIAVTSSEDLLDELKERLAGTGVAAAAGQQALLEAAAMPTDWTMSAIVGFAGLAPGLASLEHGGKLALANKESMVAAGPLVNAVAVRHGSMLIPVDSEHSAIFQAMRGESRQDLEKIVLTASGGPFRTWTAEQIRSATLSDAVAHPTWSMGQRISIDSASMFNKALEMVEAKELFEVEPDAIEVLVHPQSIVHSMVGFRDGSVIAQLGVPDMRGAIGYALNFPQRQPLKVERLDLAQVGALTFEHPDTTRFPALGLAMQVLEVGGLSGAVLNAAKEAAMDAFMAGECGFTDMADLVAEVLGRMVANGIGQSKPDSLDAVQLADQEARQRVRKIIEARSS